MSTDRDPEEALDREVPGTLPDAAPVAAPDPAPGLAPDIAAYDPHLASSAPEHDWAAAQAMLFPVLRPAGTTGTAMAEVDREQIAQDGLHAHAQPLVDPGPADLTVAYVLRTGSFDILVNADHLVSWRVDADVVRAAAFENLRTWSATAPWTDELSGDRRLLASDTGSGCDAARVLLPDVRAYLAAELGQDARVLVGLPNRELLVAGALHENDHEFGGLFAGFVTDLSTDADEPIDARIFELVDGELTPLEPTPA